jgi:alpha-mannosidase
MSETSPTSVAFDLATGLDRLRSLSRQVCDHWCWCAGDFPLPTLADGDCSWQPFRADIRGYWVWPAGETRWLATRITVPEHLHHFPTEGQSLRLGLVWWAIAVEIYVDGQLVQEGDLFDARARVLLGTAVQPGDSWEVCLRLAAPHNDQGAIMESLLLYESNDPHQPEPAHIADEIAVAQRYGLPLDSALFQDWSWPPEIPVAIFHQRLQTLRQVCAQAFARADHRIQLLGHAHLDLAWLWPVAETWEVAERTFRSVLDLQGEFPQLTFGHTSPVLYDWIARHRPQLFAQIQHQVKIGRWEVLGGMWVEPDLNLISGESIARQLLYGQRYCQQAFGQVSTVAWLPDTFGFSPQLPQLLCLGEMQYFVTQKMLWNDTNPFPHALFWWQSPDGSRVLGWMSGPIGEGFDPLKVADHGAQWHQSTGDCQSLWLLGVGDHGGGPTRDMLAVQARWQQSPLCPPLAFTTVENYLARQSRADWPQWQGELYLEFHRGCYTTHADQKRSNRRAERDLYQAELWTTIAQILQGPVAPLPEIEQAWKLVLFQQFHDILPGSAIAEVYTQANQEWEQARAITDRLQVQALQAIGQGIDRSQQPHPQAQPIGLFNSLNWPRSAVAFWTSDRSQGQIVDDRGQPLPAQWRAGVWQIQIASLPSVGYQLLWWIPGSPAATPPLPQHWRLANAYVAVEIDDRTGDILTLRDLQHHRDLLIGPGNQLQAYRDAGQYWDAWNIDPQYQEYPLPAAQLLSMQWLEATEIAQAIEVVRRIGQSTFTQIYRLESHSPQLLIQTQVDWQEEHVLVKALFPLPWQTPMVITEAACSVVERPTSSQDKYAQAQWEVPLHRWIAAPHPQGDGGIALLNDSKYGGSYQSDRLELTLLRASTWPDPQADRGHQEFTYALYPYQGSWQSAQIVQRGYELNSPVQVVDLDPGAGSLPPVGSFIDLGANSLVLMAVYPSLEQAGTVVLRCYEGCGQKTECCLGGRLGFSIDRPISLLETPGQNTERTLPGAEVKPWQIQSWWVHYQQ